MAGVMVVRSLHSEWAVDAGMWFDTNPSTGSGQAQDERGCWGLPRGLGCCGLCGSTRAAGDVAPAHHERGRALRAEEIQCFSQTARGIVAILLVENGNEPAPTATEDSDPGKDAPLKGYEIAGQEYEPEK